MARPSTLCHRGNEQPRRQVATRHSNRIPGIVAACVYEGTTIEEYEIEVEGRQITADVANPRRKRPFEQGAKVAVVFIADDVGVIDEGA